MDKLTSLKGEGVTVLMVGGVGMGKEGHVAWVEGLVVAFGGGEMHKAIGVFVTGPKQYSKQDYSLIFDAETQGRLCLGLCK